MEQPHDLDSLYQEAQAALAAKDFQRARDLLKQILLIDENYRDASRLLAKLVKQQQSRWYLSRWLWGILGVAAIVALGIVLAGKLSLRPSVLTQPLMSPTSTSTPIPASPTLKLVPTIASPTPSVMPTSIPLVWERLWVGQELGRDSVTAIALDPTDPDILYVGTEDAGVYRSIDGGISWQPMHNGLGRAWVLSLVIDPADPEILYAGVSTGGVYKTTDGGENWFAVNNGINDFGWEWVTSAALDPRDKQHLFYMAHNALYETRNGGEDWTKIHEGYPSECFLNLIFHPLDSQILFAPLSNAYSYCTGGVAKSEDGGSTWEIIGLVGIQHAVGLQIIAIDQQSGEHVYLATWDGIFGSRDSGNTWQLLNNENCKAIQVAPEDGNVVYCVVDNRILITNDGGITWRSHERHFVSAFSRMAAIGVSPHHTQVLFIGGQGVHASIDGGNTWEVRSSGLGASRIELTLDPSDDSILYMEQRVDGFLYRSMDHGKRWTLLDDDSWDLALGSSGEWLYRIGEGGLLKSSDQALSWEQSPWPLNIRPGTIAVHPKRPQWLYITYDNVPGIFVSKDGGNTWESTKGVERIFDGRLYFDHEGGDVIYVVGTGSVFRSYNGGESWSQCDHTGEWYSRSTPRLVVGPRDSNRLILATRGAGILISEDGCQSWRSSNDGLGSLFVNTVAFDPKDPDTLYAGSDSGAYVSFDDGISWNEINTGLLGATIVYSIVVDLESNVYAATPYGVFKLGIK
jgi:photosystem II stability/assembly factor-like uncharacterized protein